MKQHNRDILFFNAVVANDQRGIATYYRYAYTKIVPKLKKQFKPQLSEHEIDSNFNDAFLIICNNYIKGGKWTVEFGKIVEMTSDSFLGILYTITSFRQINLIKKKGGHGAKKITEAEGLYDLLYAVESFENLSEVEKSLQSSLVWKALNKLRTLCRVLLRMKIIDGNSYEKIAAHLDSKDGILRVQKNRCLEQLRTKYHKLSKHGQVK